MQPNVQSKAPFHPTVCDCSDKVFTGTLLRSSEFNAIIDVVKTVNWLCVYIGYRSSFSALLQLIQIVLHAHSIAWHEHSFLKKASATVFFSSWCLIHPLLQWMASLSHFATLCHFSVWREMRQNGGARTLLLSSSSPFCSLCSFFLLFSTFLPVLSAIPMIHLV